MNLSSLESMMVSTKVLAVKWQWVVKSYDMWNLGVVVALDVGNERKQGVKIDSYFWLKTKYGWMVELFTKMGKFEGGAGLE